MIKPNNEFEEEHNRDFYISTQDENGEYVIYSSESFRLSEINILGLIKVCLIEGRSKEIGKKLLSIYRDSTIERKHITKKRLELIGIKEEEAHEPPKKEKSPKLK